MPTVDSGVCTACGVCADVCPVEAIKIDDVAVIDASKCIECLACVDECPTGAMKE